MSLAASLVPLALGALLGWSGAVKAFSRAPERQAAGTALERATGGIEPAVRALRAVGAVELLVAAGLLALPGHVLTGTAAAVLGTGFVAYLVYARVTVPESSCGCSARDDAPVGPRAFARAGLVLAGGVIAAGGASPWWEAARQRPGTAAAVLACCVLLAAVVSVHPDRYVLPLRRTRLRLLGHPLGTAPQEVPVEASVELLERSLAWEAAAGIVRSGLLDHWEEDGWRFLLFSGVRADEAGEHRVSVLFALDSTATLDTAGTPAVRVTVVDDASQQPVPGALPDVSGRKVLPLV
jgi:hypothetical protein